MLTDSAIRAAKSKTGQTVKLSDGGGLQLWVQPSGSKLWNLAYRFAGKQRKLAIGSYPGIGLKEARAKREESCWPRVSIRANKSGSESWPPKIRRPIPSTPLAARFWKRSAGKESRRRPSARRSGFSISRPLHWGHAPSLKLPRRKS